MLSIFRMEQSQVHSQVQSVFLDSLCCTGGTGMHIYCVWSFFKVHNNSIGCIFMRKKTVCLSNINWIYCHAFHLQQLKTRGLVWGYILGMDHRLLVSFCEKLYLLISIDHLRMQGANSHVNFSSQKVGMVNEHSISVAQKRIKRVASKRKQ